MIYMVECSFTDPVMEDQWNAFYSGPKLTALLGNVDGFRQSQRFRDIDGGDVPYLAAHEVVSNELLETQSYKNAGGGSFLHFQPYIKNWRRTIFSGLDRLPEVSPDQRLIVIDSAPKPFPGITVHWLRSAGLGHIVPSRGVAIVSAEQAAALKQEEGIRILGPLNPLMRARQ
ncbi:MAG: hypothetical protein ABGX47_20415 [Martelella sp.]|uniref:hypothetical protein n=1 Tax=Martelella sp. TaxID=1969699 RepID=UPI00324220D7